MANFVWRLSFYSSGLAVNFMNHSSVITLRNLMSEFQHNFFFFFFFLNFAPQMTYGRCKWLKHYNVQELISHEIKELPLWVHGCQRQHLSVSQKVAKVTALHEISLLPYSYILSSQIPSWLVSSFTSTHYCFFLPPSPPFIPGTSPVSEELAFIPVPLYVSLRLLPFTNL